MRLRARSGKGDMPRPVNPFVFSQNHQKIDFSTFRKEMAEKRK